MPSGVAGRYDADAYRSFQAYTRVQTRFDWVSSTSMLAITLIVWFAGKFEWLDDSVRS